MNIGKFDLDESWNISPDRRTYRKEIERPKDNFNDLMKLFLLFFMLLGGAVGGYNKYIRNNPTNVITRSMEESLERSFSASLEGSTIIKSFLLGDYRSRQKYSPQKGLEQLPDTKKSGETAYSHQTPFDALSALKSLRYATKVIEHDREDMYGHGTRYFTGSLSLPDSGELIAYVFEYWIDMRTQHPVRLVVSKVERNVAVDSQGNFISRETYINIRYYDWH